MTINLGLYATQINDRAVERVEQSIEKFNAASGGTIVLDSKKAVGAFTKESMFASFASAQRRVDIEKPDGDVEAIGANFLDDVAVKIAGGFGPIKMYPAQLEWLLVNPKSAIDAIATGFAEALLSDQLNTALAAGVAAFSNNPLAFNDLSLEGISFSGLNSGHAKFGDSSSTLIADVMHSTAYHKLIGKALANEEKLFTSSNVRIVEILGKKYVITDSPALFDETGADKKLNILHLSASGLTVSESSKPRLVIVEKTGKEQIVTEAQADYNFMLKIKGYSWDMVSGGKSPSNAALKTGANWQPVGGIKSSAGALTTVSASK